MLVRGRYIDFAFEKLAEVLGLTIGMETLRLWMIKAAIWVLCGGAMGWPRDAVGEELKWTSRPGGKPSRLVSSSVGSRNSWALPFLVKQPLAR